MEKNRFYAVLGKQKSLPVYLAGIGVADPEYHIRREKGLNGRDRKAGRI